MKTLYVAYRDEEGKQWRPIGCLRRVNKNKFTFNYTCGVKKISAFNPLSLMKDLETTYESEELFPFLRNRILGKKRPEYSQLIRWLDLEDDNNDEDNDLWMLALTEGRRATDALTIFPCPTKNTKNEYVLDFFVSGISHLENDDIINSLNVGDRLYPLRDYQNHYDEWALLLMVDAEPVSLVGYCPRYFSKDFCSLVEKNTQEFRVVVKKINIDAPYQFRLLCELSAPWPDNFQPCSGEDYEPYTSTCYSGQGTQ